jgi:hypothetical protein
MAQAVIPKEEHYDLQDRRLGSLAAPVPLTYERKTKDQHIDSGSRCTRRQLLDRIYSRQRRSDSPGHDRLNSLAHHPGLDSHEAYIRFVLQARQCATVERRLTAADSAVSECASAEAARSTTRDLLWARGLIMRCPSSAVLLRRTDGPGRLRRRGALTKSDTMAGQEAWVVRPHRTPS